MCEDYPCCGHELGDCNGQKYGSDASIQSNPHLLCDHENGDCEVQYDDDGDEDEEDEDDDDPNQYREDSYIGAMED